MTPSVNRRDHLTDEQISEVIAVARAGAAVTDLAAAHSLRRPVARAVLREFLGRHDPVHCDPGCRACQLKAALRVARRQSDRSPRAGARASHLVVVGGRLVETAPHALDTYTDRVVESCYPRP